MIASWGREGGGDLERLSKGFERSWNVKKKNFDHTGYSEANFLIDLNTKTGNSRTVIKGRASVRQVERKINWRDENDTVERLSI